MNPFNTRRKVFAVGARLGEVPLPEADTDAQVETGLNRRARRRVFRRLNFGAVPGFSPLCLDSNDPATVENGFKRRLLRKTPFDERRHDPEMLRRFSAFVNNYVSKLPKVNPLEFEEWLEGTSYDNNRKEQLRRTREALHGGRPSSRQCSHIDSFVKGEHYPEYKPARMINSRSDAFKAFSGPYFKSLENMVYSTIPEFIKHVPMAERSKAINELRKVGNNLYSTDFTAFESHFLMPIMHVCECALYRHCFSNSNDGEFIARVIEGQNRMRTRTGVRAECWARRMSGDMCTSLGNGFTNLMLAKFLASEQHCEITGYVEGDDGLFCTNAELTAEAYEKLGFTIKIAKISDISEASFCGMVFGPSCEIIRDPRRFLQGFGWSQSFLHAGSSIMDELLRAKSLSTCYETPQCPIVGVLARKALELTRHVRQIGRAHV